MLSYLITDYKCLRLIEHKNSNLHKIGNKNMNS